MTFTEPQVTYGDGLALDTDAPFLFPQFSSYRYDDFGQLQYVVAELEAMVDAGDLSVTDLLRQRGVVRDYVGAVLKGLRFNGQDHRQEPIGDNVPAETLAKIQQYPVGIRALVNGPYVEVERDTPMAPRKNKFVVRVHEGTGAKSYRFDTEEEAKAFMKTARPSVSFVRSKKPVPTAIRQSRAGKLGVSDDGSNYGQRVRPMVAEKVNYGQREVTLPLASAWIALGQHGRYGINHVSTRMRDKHWTLEEVTEPQPQRAKKGA